MADSESLINLENSIIAEIYKCALEPSNWRNVLAAIQNRLDALEVTIMFYDASVRGRNFAAAAKANDAMVARFVSEFIDIEADVARKTMESFAEGEVIDVIALREKAGETYEKSLGEAGQFDSRSNWEVQIAVPLLVGVSIYCSMGVYQLPGAQKATQEAIQFIKMLSPHLVQAVRIHNHISCLHQENISLYASIQRSPLGIFLIDQHGSVVFSNGEAMRIVKSYESIKISRFGRLQVISPNDQQQLDCVLHKVLSNGCVGLLYNDGVTIPIHKLKHLHPLKITIVPFVSRTISDKDIRATIFVNDPDRLLKIPFEYVRQVYKLTRVECEIAQALLDSISIEKIAVGRGTTVGTARWQVKKIMEKTQCHSQGDLCKLMQLLCDNFSIHSAVNYQ